MRPSGSGSAEALFHSAKKARSTSPPMLWTTKSKLPSHPAIAIGLRWSCWTKRTSNRAVATLE